MIIYFDNYLKILCIKILLLLLYISKKWFIQFFFISILYRFKKIITFNIIFLKYLI